MDEVATAKRKKPVLRIITAAVTLCFTILSLYAAVAAGVLADGPNYMGAVFYQAPFYLLAALLVLGGQAVGSILAIVLLLLTGGYANIVGLLALVLNIAALVALRKRKKPVPDAEGLPPDSTPEAAASPVKKGLLEAGKALAWAFLALLLLGFVSIALLFGPRFRAANRTAKINGCTNNMRMLESGKEQWQLAASSTSGQRLPVGSPIDIPAMCEYIKGSTMPTCPGKGEYDVGTVGYVSSCSVHGLLFEQVEYFNTLLEGSEECLAFRAKLDSAKDVWAAKNGLKRGAKVTLADLQEYLGEEKSPCDSCRISPVGLTSACYKHGD